MDIQVLIDTITQAGQDNRKSYHLTLGALIEIMDKNPSFPVVNKEGLYICEPHSYRGYYSDLSFETSSDAPEGLLSTLKNQTLDKEFTGYKGGEFIMSADTPLWVAPYGHCGDAVVDYIVSDGRIILVTKNVD